MSKGIQFQERVRRVARARWNLPEGAGGNDYVNHQEFDIVCVTQDVTHLIMCTVSETSKKVREDVDKLVKARNYLLAERSVPGVCWVITEKEPHQDQRGYAQKHGVRIESLAEFERQLIDAPQYFTRRRDYRFGSATDPFKKNSDRVPDDEYVELTIVDRESGKRRSLDSVIRQLTDGEVVVLTADFGSGKSLTLREAFFRLRDRYLNPDVTGDKPVPLAINLREHARQEHYADVLRQHARRIAYPHEEHLVRVWQGGQAVVLLDGFDELPAVQLIDASPRSRSIARREATKIIREFVQSSRSRGGVLLVGRGQYFDSVRELRECCGLRGSDSLYELQPFSERQVAAYLGRRGAGLALPSWLSRTPLLIAYLLAEQLLAQVAGDKADDKVEAWLSLIDQVCERESQSFSGMFQGHEIRQLMERLASRSRLKSQGNGSVDAADIDQAFRDVFDTSPLQDEHARGLLQRLPGLTSSGGEPHPEGNSGAPDRRTFIDADMLDTLRGADLIRYVQNPYPPFVRDMSRPAEDQHQKLAQPLSGFGCELAARVAVRSACQPRLHLAAAQRAHLNHRDPTLALDCLVTAAMRPDVETFDCEGEIIRDGSVETLDLSDIHFRRLTIQDGCVNVLSIPDEQPDRVRLENCYFGLVEGASEPAGLPEWIAAPVVEVYESAANASALMKLDLALPVRVGLTVLKKVYRQRGSGRKEGAFSRGLPPAARALVPKVLDALRTEGLIVKTTTRGVVIWHPNAAVRERALTILDGPNTCEDYILMNLRAIS